MNASVELLPLLLLAVLLVVLGVIAWRQRRLPAALPISIAMMMLAAWSLSDALGFFSSDLEGKLLWYKISLSMLAAIPIAWLTVVVMTTGQVTGLARSYLPILLIVPAVSWALVWFGRLGDSSSIGVLILDNLRLVHISSGLASQLSPVLIERFLVRPEVRFLNLALAFQPGGWFWLQWVYSHLLILLGLAMLVYRFAKVARRMGQPAPVASRRLEDLAAHQDSRPTTKPGARKKGPWRVFWKNFLKPKATFSSGSPPRQLFIFALIFFAGATPTIFDILDYANQISMSYRAAQVSGVPFSLAHVTIYNFHSTPYTLVVTGLLFAWLLTYYRSWENQQRIIPVAHGALINNMPDGMMVLDRQNRLVDLNPAARRMLGFDLDLPVERLRGLAAESALAQWPDLLVALGVIEAPPDPSTTPLEGDLYADTGGRTVRLARQGRLSPAPEDATRFIDLRVSAIFEDDGMASGRLVVLRDITQRKQADEDLRQLKDFNEAIVQGMSEGIAVEDPEGRITFINQAGAAMLGYVPSEMIGRITLRFIAPEQASLLDLVNQRRRQGQGGRYEFDLLRKDGAWISALVNDMPRFDPKTQEFTSSLLVLMDITERRLSEKALHASDQRHRRLVEQLSTLNRIGLAVLSPAERFSDLPNPLGIEGVIHVLYQQCQQIGEMDCFYVAIFDEESHEIAFPVIYDRDKHGKMIYSKYDALPIDDPTRLTAYVLRSKRSFNLPDLLDEAQLPKIDGNPVRISQFGDMGARSYLGAPLILGSQNRDFETLDGRSSTTGGRSKVIGVISMQKTESYFYSDEQLHLLENVALQAAIALENSRLYEQAQAELVQRRQVEEALRLANQRLQAQLSEIENLQIDLQNSLKLISEQAIRDPLTNLFNRRYLHETLERELARAARLNLPVSVVMADIDHFKQLNDHFLHEAGDRVLQSLSNLLRAQSRQEDVTCRFGGEEFVVVMPGATTEIAFQRAERWRLAFRTLEFVAAPTGEANLPDEVLLGNTPGSFCAAISLGVATYPEHGRTSDALLRAADQAMYNAKQTGRNCTRIFGVSGYLTTNTEQGA